MNPKDKNNEIMFKLLFLYSCRSLAKIVPSGPHGRSGTFTGWFYANNQTNAHTHTQKRTYPPKTKTALTKISFTRHVAPHMCLTEAV